MHVDLRQLAGRQDDVAAVWQLTGVLGWTAEAVAHRTGDMPRILDGVLLTSCAPPSRRQWLRAATLTTPRSFLTRESALEHFDLLGTLAPRLAVVRPGDGGPLRCGAVAVHHSRSLAGDVVVSDGLPVTTVARTLADVAPRVGRWRLRRLVREALRRRLVTAPQIMRQLARRPGRRGSLALRDVTERYARLGLDRTRSDAEALALEVLDDAGIEPPRVNETVLGGEADLYFPARGLVVEIDGTSFHVLRDDDVAKANRWRAGGLAVARVPSDDVYNAPERLVAAVTRHRASNVNPPVP